MRRIIIYSVWGVLLCMALSSTMIGCSTATSSKSSNARQATIAGTPAATTAKVVQWCSLYRYEVLNHGNEYLVARIADFRWQDGEYVFEGNCGVPAVGSTGRNLGDPRMKVSVEQAPGQPDMSVISVVLSGRSSYQDCRSSGVVEQKLFEYLRTETGSSQ